MESDRWKPKYFEKLYLHDCILLASSIPGAAAAIIVLLFVKPTSMLSYEPFLATMVIWAGLLLTVALLGTLTDTEEARQKSSLNGGVTILALLMTVLSLSFSIPTYTIVGYFHPEHLSWALVLPVHGAIVVLHSIYLIMSKKVTWETEDMKEVS